MRWQAHELELSSSQSVGASKTDEPISYVFSIISDPRLLRVDIVFSSVTVAADVVIKLQDTHDGTTWRDVKTNNTPVTSATPVMHSITINPNVDTTEALLPMRDRARVVLTTGVGDAAAITSVKVYRMEG